MGSAERQSNHIARAFARAGYTVHAPQLAGHCGSVIAGGLSMGAVLALHHAARPASARHHCTLAQRNGLRAPKKRVSPCTSRRNGPNA